MRVSDAMTHGPRILMVVRLFHPWVGGTERQAEKLAQALQTAGLDVRVVTGRWFRGTPRREILHGVHVDRNHTLWEFWGFRGLRTVGGYVYILTLLWHLWRRRAEYDVIHVHGLNYHTFAAVLAGRRLHKPTLVKLANSGFASDIAKMREDRQLRLARFMLPTALRCDLFVALNAAVVRELKAAGVDPSRIIELPNGVDTSVAAKDTYDLGDPSTIVYVGRLHPQKGLDSLLAAFAMLREDQGAPVTLRLIGDGPARNDLEHLARDLGVADAVDFVGQCDDVEPALRRADVFVLPSRVEGLSNALLEAMATGVPVIATDIPGNRQVIHDGVDGLLTPVDDPAALCTRMGRVLADQRLRASLGRAARDTVCTGYGLEAVADRYADVYRSLVGTAVQPRTGIVSRRSP